MSSHFPPREVMSETTANMLLEIDAVHFNAEKPFTFTSGIASPVYIDCRKIIAYPRLRDMVTAFSVSLILRDVGFEQFDAVAGGETAGIPFAAWIAKEMGLPMHYVRKKPKGFGRAAQIEGDIQEEQRVLLVEDLTTDGGSKINFCNALRRAGAKADHAIVVFYYDIFQQTRDRLDADGITLHSLATWWDVLSASKKQNRFDTKTLTEVEGFLNAPLDWSARHGGISHLTL
ncbi:orotate phosphoribosyltransferase [Neptunicoccus cionae]|uniref:Orotate phosphoribosyltransferase n=1 Tax=Neptunicoccus cionae TaxID=2035344 RepID=A0A916R3B3_9RHOB|nr:orotate phosphoribosyltransferase [Amylibacter cionae]GGA28382.1 orotate phosphoribosyltransferase [Amylibacter cionae]